MDADGKPEASTHEETTLSGADRIRKIAEAVHKNGGKVIANINFTLAWEVGNVERYADVLLAGFDTYPSATLDVIFGRFHRSETAAHTSERRRSAGSERRRRLHQSERCAGYDKDQYMPDAMKDENGKAYAYRDAAGNYYELDFGLRYE